MLHRIIARAIGVGRKVAVVESDNSVIVLDRAGGIAKRVIGDGAFQQYFDVVGRDGQRCVELGNGLLVRTVIQILDAAIVGGLGARRVGRWTCGRFEGWLWLCVGQ